MNRTAACAAGAIAALVLTSCAGASDDQSGRPSGTPSATPSTSATNEPMDGVRPKDADPADAVPRAVTVLRTWAQPTLDAGTWWAELEPLLDDRARGAYASTDPSTIPALKITGKAKLAPDTASGQVVVDVPTNQRVYGVQMAYQDGTWLMDRIYFPGSERE